MIFLPTARLNASRVGTRAACVSGSSGDESKARSPSSPPPYSSVPSRSPRSTAAANDRWPSRATLSGYRYPGSTPPSASPRASRRPRDSMTKHAFPTSRRAADAAAGRARSDDRSPPHERRRASPDRRGSPRSPPLPLPRSPALPPPPRSGGRGSSPESHGQGQVAVARSMSVLMTCASDAPRKLRPSDSALLGEVSPLTPGNSISAVASLTASLRSTRGSSKPRSTMAFANLHCPEEAFT